MERYIEYLRKSQMDRDYEELTVEETLARHRKILADFTKQKGINVTVVLEEVVSGESLSARPQMLKLLELINTGQYAGVVCMDIDRLSRGSSFDSGYIMQVLQINHCKIVTPGKTYDLLNESDEQFTDMKFMFSRYELKTITKRLLRGRRESTAEGKYVMSVPPYGYSIEKLQGTKGSMLKIIPEEAKIVKMIFDMYTEKGMGYETIQYHLNQMHIPPKKSCKEWSKTSVVNIITNETYIGKLKWGETTQKKIMVDGQLRKKRVRNVDYEVFDGLHEPIISAEQWEKAKSIRAKRYNPSTSIGKELKHPFAGLLYCSKCGKLMKRNVSDHNTAPWYRCQTMGCKCGTIKCHKLEQIIIDQMRDWLDNYIIEIDASTETVNFYDDALESIQAQLTSLQEQQNKICDLLETGVYSVQIFQQRNNNIQKDIDRLKRDETDLLAQMQNQTKEDAAQIIETTQHLLDSYEKLDIRSKNTLWRQVLERITYEKATRSKEPAKITIYPKLAKKP